MFYFPLFSLLLFKIVRALWLGERSVCMRAFSPPEALALICTDHVTKKWRALGTRCKHGCGSTMVCFSRCSHARTTLKKFSSSKLDKFTLFTHSFVGWNLENRYKEGVSFFLRLSWHFKRGKSVFWKASFCKTRTDYTCKTSWTRLLDW